MIAINKASSAHCASELVMFHHEVKQSQAGPPLPPPLHNRGTSNRSPTSPRVPTPHRASWRKLYLLQGHHSHLWSRRPCPCPGERHEGRKWGGVPCISGVPSTKAGPVCAPPPPPVEAVTGVEVDEKHCFPCPPWFSLALVSGPILMEFI